MSLSIIQSTTVSFGTSLFQIFGRYKIENLLEVLVTYIMSEIIIDQEESIRMKRKQESIKDLKRDALHKFQGESHHILKKETDREIINSNFGNVEEANIELKSEKTIDIKQVETEEKKDRWVGFRKKTEAVLESNYIVVSMTVITIFVLFSGDIKYLLPIDVDWSFNFISTMALSLFTLELILSSYAIKGYFLDFFFWLDLIAIISFIFEIDWIFLKMIGEDSNQSASAAKAITKVTTASRITRVLRIIRIIRLIRIVKLYKSAMQARANRELKRKEKEEKMFKSQVDISTTRKRTSNLKARKVSTKDSAAEEKSRRRASISQIKSKALKDTDFNDKEITKENNINKIISKKITEIVIIIIMTMLIVLPVISEDFYASDSDKNYVSWVELYDEYKVRYDKNIPETINKAFTHLLENEQISSFPVISMDFDKEKIYENADYFNDLFRYDEIRYLASASEKVVIAINIKYEVQMQAIFNIVKTIITCLVLTIAALEFESNTKEKVLDPLEVMIEIVDKVAKDPANARNIEELQGGVKSTLSKKDGEEQKDKPKEENYEINVIQSAIVKISALLAIAFGEAGGNVVKQNMNSSSELNPMINGNKTNCIFGFCDIRGFPEVTEIIQEKIMIFVNTIAETIHSNVDRFQGETNKNLGDVFVCAWKLKDEQGEEIREVTPDNIYCQRLADNAVVGFISAFNEIHRKEELQKYINDPQIQAKLKNFKINMGFGLNVGWAIEGAIGSSSKIDCSYLSENVNISARLMLATRQYGVSMLISGVTYDLLSPGMKELFRCIDVITVKGSKQIIGVYTVDLNQNLRMRRKFKYDNLDVKKKYYEMRKRKTMFRLSETQDMQLYIDQEEEFNDLFDTKQNTSQFITNWESGFKAYIAGQWQLAKTHFNFCKEFCNDGPANTLLNYMQSYSYQAPAEWKGYRKLMSK